MQRHWLVTAGLLFAVWLPTLLELILYSPNNLQQLLAYRSRSAGAGTSWPHAAAYVLDRLSPVGFGRFHNTYQPAVSGVTVAAGAIGVLLLALGAFAGTHRPNTVGSRACGVAVITVPVEAWGLTHLTGFTVGYWLLPCLVIAAFACAAVLTRAIELIPRRRWSSVLRLVPPVARTTIAALLATSACALASTTASPPAWAAEDQARHASAVVLRFLRQHANPGVPVVVQGSGISSLSLNSAIGFQLDRRVTTPTTCSRGQFRKTLTRGMSTMPRQRMSRSSSVSGASAARGRISVLPDRAHWISDTTTTAPNCAPG